MIRQALPNTCATLKATLRTLANSNAALEKIFDEIRFEAMELSEDKPNPQIFKAQRPSRNSDALKTTNATTAKEWAINQKIA